ncbi:hypothetical protein GINT2_001530 [Glugoides intestinalis]
MRFSIVLIASTLISCRVSPVEVHDLVEKFKAEKKGIISSLNLNYENSLLNPMIGEPYKCTGLLSNLRFFGPGIIPGSIPTKTQRSYPNDKSNHPLIQFIIKLFPSPAGTLNHLCTHSDHLTKLFVESNSTDKIENASDLLVCSITGESFKYTGEGINEDIKRLEEEKAKLEKSINKNEVEAIKKSISNMTTEKTGIEKNLRILNKKRKEEINEMGVKNDTIKLLTVENKNFKSLEADIKKLKMTLEEKSFIKKIKELEKNIKLNQEIEEKTKSAFEDLGKTMSEALKNKKSLNPQLLLPMIIHEFVKSAFSIEELKEYMQKSLIKIKEKLSVGNVSFDELKAIDAQLNWGAALTKIYRETNTFPYSKFNLPVSNISIPSYIRGKDGEEGYFDEKRLYADCADVAIMQLCNCLLFNPKDKICELSHLGNAKLEPELEDFYKTHSNPFASTTLEKRKDWSKVVQDRRDLTLPDNNDFQTHRIIYNRDNRNEIKSDFINMMSVIALIFGIDRKPIFNGLNEGNILKRFEELLQGLVAPGMSVEIDKADSDTLKVGKDHSRTEFSGKVNIKFSYKDDRENESRTTMAIKHKESHTDFMFVQNNSKEIDLTEEIKRLGNVSGFKEFSFPSMINRVFLMAGNNPLPKGNVLEDMYASGLVESNEKKLEMMKIVYENMPKDRNQEGTGIFNSETPEGTNEWNDFTSIIDSILENVPLEDPAVFNMFAPFLLYSEKHKEKLNGFDLRLIFNLNNEKLKEHWIKHADERVGTLRFLFDIEKTNYYVLSEELEFFKNFSKLTDVKLRYGYSARFDKSKTWSNSMEILKKILKEIPTCTKVELVGFDSEMLKDFIDGAAKSNLDVLLRLNKLKIVFDDESGIRYLNSAVKNFPYLFKYLPKLSEITIENQADRYTPREGHESDNLVNLIEELPTDRDIKINLIGRFVESEIFNALKETPEKVEVSIVYKLYSFDKFRAGILKDKIEDPKLNIKIFSTRNGIERHLPITTENLENLFKAKDFFFRFGSRQEIEFDHTNMNDFLSSFGPFFQEREWDLVIYRDKKPRTEICELPEFVKAFNTSESIRFGSNFLDLSNENDTNDFISEVNRRNKRLLLYASEILIDSENLIKIYNKMQEKENFTVKAKSWLIRVENKNMDTFKDKFEEIYKTLYPEGLYQNEFLDKIEALSKLSELDAFTIDLSNKDVIYIGDKEFDPFLQVLPTIKNMFEKVIVAKDAFSIYQIYKLTDELGKDPGSTQEIGTGSTLKIGTGSTLKIGTGSTLKIGTGSTQEIGTEEFLLKPGLKGQSITNESYLIRLFLWLKPIFRYYS